MLGERSTARADDVSRVVELPPENGVLTAIGRDHTLTTALADLIDNSIDAHADTVTIRIVTTDSLLHTVRVRDNGDGMSGDELQLAMRLGERREYAATDHGHFGMGLKAASLSQSRTLTVFTLGEGDVPRAIRIGRQGFQGEVLTDQAAWSGFEDDPGSLDSTGTVVKWSGVENVSRASSPTERQMWLERLVGSLRTELGLTFHRLLFSGRLRISVEVFDDAVTLVGVRRNVEPVDPFGFQTSGHANYPVSVTGLTDDGCELTAALHILPPNSKSASAEMLGRPRREWQGFYIYRNDRLLHAAGWLEQAHSDRRLQLARVAIDLTPALENHLRINHEKHGVRPLEGFGLALQRARSTNGIGFERFLEDARDTFQRANKRRTGIKPLIPMSEGLSEGLTENVRERIGEREDVLPIAMRWRQLEEGRVFLFDPDARTIWLNDGYRTAIGGVTGDAPLLKTLTYLLLQDRFASKHVRRGTKEEIEAWQSVLMDALLEQIGADGYRSTSSAGDDASPSPLRGLDEVGHLTSAASDGFPVSAEPADHTAPAVLPEQVDETAESSPEVTSADPSIIAELYSKGATIAETAQKLSVDGRAVARVLCLHVLGLDEPLDDESLSPRHGLVYTPEERDRIVAAYRSGTPIARIAQDTGRTPLAVGWQLLDHPSRPVLVKRSLIRRLRRATPDGDHDG